MTDNEIPGTSGTGSTSGTGGAGTGTQDGPRVSHEEMRDLASIRRSTTDKHIAGVSGGLGRHFDIDPVVFRVAFVVLSFFGGAGLLLYAAGWLLLPLDDGSRATLDLDNRSRSVALVGVCVLAALALIGDAWGPGWFPWPLILVGLIVWLVLTRKDRREAREQVDAARTGLAYADPEQPPTTAPPLRPRNPRKRGPILFWYTLALIGIGVGILGVFDLAGFDVLGSAYPALVLGIIATMLLVGAFYGRAGGLILLGLITAVVLSLSTVADRWDGSQIRETPASAAELDSHYEASMGEVVLDLTEIEDLDELDGRDIRVDLDMGRIEVIVPRDLTVDVDARMEAGGDIWLFGERDGRTWAYSMTSLQRGGADAPEIDLDLDLSFGEIRVVTR